MEVQKECWKLFKDAHPGPAGEAILTAHDELCAIAGSQQTIGARERYFTGLMSKFKTLVSAVI